MANRNEKASKKKKKREERQRAARAAPRMGAPDDRSPPSPAEIDRMLAPIAGDVATALETDAAAAARLAHEKSDRALAEAWRLAGTRPGCDRGCSYCCRGLRVDTTVPEVAAIASYLREQLSPDDLARVAERVSANAEKAHGTTVMGYPAQMPCALLDESGKCIVYLVRPLPCRTDSSLDADACAAGYEEQLTNGTEVDVPKLPQVMFAGTKCSAELRNAIRDRNLKTPVVELQEAVHIALSDAKAVDRWFAGEDAFAQARVNTRADEKPSVSFGDKRRLPVT